MQWTMGAQERAAAVETLLRAEAAALRIGAAWPRGAVAEVRLAEIAGSMRLAGVDMREREIATLVDDSSAPGGRSLEHCNAVADYANASAHVAAIGRTRPHRGLLRVEEIVALHALATRRSSADRPGKWRSTTSPTLRSGAVPPPAWLVPRDVAALVERFAGGPPADRPFLPWLADYYGRFTRIAPFATANGRVARLSLNLMLARLRYPPLVVRGGEARLFTAALDRAAARDLWPLAHFLGRSILESVRTLDAARANLAETLFAIGRIVAPDERAALYKAAQRGRLRTVRRGTAVYTSKAWVDEYRSSRAKAGRPVGMRPD